MDWEKRGYTVRPSSLPLEASSSEGATEDHGTASHFHALKVPVKFDTDGISTPNYSPPRRQENNFNMDDTPHIHIHRVTCNDFPSTWQPARRIITFMGLVSLICTLLVVVIIIIAVALSKTAHPRTTPLRHSELVYLVPQPRKFINRTPTIVVHRQNPRIWQKHVEDLATLVKAYRERQGAIATSNCDLHYAPIGVSSCSFPLDRISDNCTLQNNFGYDTGNPCVALHGYDFQQLVPITCNTSVASSEESNLFHVHYSPFPGFPFRYLPMRGMMGSTLPPLVMIQFIGPQTMADVEVSCYLWAKNLPRNVTNDPGSIRFSFFIV
ncbi:Sodium/potassium-transporting ATPase subunit like protein [Argiope bruennichi]|uniref:Sodium/potassium-transporting ATPase subunit like protein n=1 Tax=Argiope bruennichi TaxID=94029 RepID=A0A8T0F8M7_ARGBR|nr:Sodium/potassium-transporting ATPase subunit like protein [Argiope bruennichi]